MYTDPNSRYKEQQQQQQRDEDTFENKRG